MTTDNEPDLSQPGQSRQNQPSHDATSSTQNQSEKTMAGYLPPLLGAVGAITCAARPVISFWVFVIQLVLLVSVLFYWCYLIVFLDRALRRRAAVQIAHLTVVLVFVATLASVGWAKIQDRSRDMPKITRIPPPTANPGTGTIEGSPTPALPPPQTPSPTRNPINCFSMALLRCHLIHPGEQLRDITREALVRYADMVMAPDCAEMQRASYLESVRNGNSIEAPDQIWPGDIILLPEPSCQGSTGGPSGVPASTLQLFLRLGEVIRHVLPASTERSLASRLSPFMSKEAAESILTTILNPTYIDLAPPWTELQVYYPMLLAPDAANPQHVIGTILVTAIHPTRCVRHLERILFQAKVDTNKGVSRIIDIWIHRNRASESALNALC